MTPYEAALIIKDGYPISWDRSDLPIDAFFDPCLNDLIIAAYRTVTVELNHLIGIDLFCLGVPWALGELPNPTPRGYISLKSFTPIPGTHRYRIYGYVTHRTQKDRILSTNIRIRDDLQSELLMTTMRHEIGHVLGLSHDNRKDSIMHSDIERNPPRDMQFTTHDVFLLRKIYG